MMEPAILLKCLGEGLAAAYIAPAFAMLFAVPGKLLLYTALGGFLTRFLRSYLVLAVNMEIAAATFLACAASSLLFIYLGPRLKTPRPVFTVASVIPLIPGMDAYTALLNMLSVIDGEGTAIPRALFIMFHRGMRCLAIMLAISLGIAVPPLFFYRRGRHQT